MLLSTLSPVACAVPGAFPRAGPRVLTSAAPLLVGSFFLSCFILFFRSFIPVLFLLLLLFSLCIFFFLFHLFFLVSKPFSFSHRFPVGLKTEAWFGRTGAIGCPDLT